MAFENRDGGKYFTILNGKFCQRVSPETPGAVQRKNKQDKIVHEIFHDSFTAKLVDIKVTDGQYGKSWVFSFQDKGDIYRLQLSYSNSYATAFLKMLPNIDLTKEMKLSPSVKEVDGKNKSSLFVNQNGQAVKHAYTKDVPNGLPNMEQVTVKGQVVWDDTKRIEFLHNMVMTQIVPRLQNGKPAQAEQTATNPVATDDIDQPGDDINPEDIPF